MSRLTAKENAIATEKERLHKVFKQHEGKNCSLAQLLARPELTYSDLLKLFPEQFTDYGDDTNRQIELEIKYAGYINRQSGEVERLSHTESINVPAGIDYHSIIGLRTEAKLRLSKVLPTNLGQASRVPGIAPADISVLMIHLQRRCAPQDFDVGCGCG
jgi:tRNA uridine 5-carboxymethylaminomethyl modification enzyme